MRVLILLEGSDEVVIQVCDVRVYGGERQERNQTSGGPEG